ETERALALIRTLPPDQAEAVMLRVVVGLDVAATARVLGKRPGAVRIAAMRGLRRLAAHPDVQSLSSPSAADRPPSSPAAERPPSSPAAERPPSSPAAERPL